MKSEHLKPYPALTEALKAVSLEGRSALITGGGHGDWPLDCKVICCT